MSDPVHLRRFVDDLRPVFRLQSPQPDLLEDPRLLAGLAGTRSYAQALALVMSAYAQKEGKTRWGEKTPGHIRRVGQILLAFPNAQVVHIVRDPRAVIVSTQQAFDDGSFTDSAVYRLARGWRRSMTLLDRYDDGGTRYRTLRYEDLVATPVPTLQALCDFLGAEYSPRMLDFHRDAVRYVRRMEDGSINSAHTLTLQALRADRSERWRSVLSPRHVALVEVAAGGVMGRFGYPLVTQDDDRPGRIRRLAAVAGADVAVARGRLGSVGERAASASRRVRSALFPPPAPPAGGE